MKLLIAATAALITLVIPGAGIVHADQNGCGGIVVSDDSGALSSLGGPNTICIPDVAG